MWDKHRQVRKNSRKRALRAAQARAAKRVGSGPSDGHAQPDPEPADQPIQVEIAASDEPDQPEEASETDAKPYDPAQSLAWTGLILLTLILGGFMAAVLFMLG
jgi:hypothetical protein